MSTRLCESAGYVERNHEWATSGRESLERASITEEIVALYREFNRRLQFLIISSRAFYFIFFFTLPPFDILFDF